ncbi:hypothetical protein [Haloterrigena sp. H1]|uniref:hypothetical protein n=1 Tax=Haloterrigena sp. H1 TaxID=2552943 RepID=UPI001BB17373|nr:hypothetical protein [Haloterrigena sp. H1]
MTRSQRYRSTSLPFSYREKGVQFSLETYSIDDQDPAPLDLKPGQTEIDLAGELPPPADDAVADWQTVALEGQLYISEETVDAVFPDEERDCPPAKLYVTIRCHETIYRDRVVVSDAPTTPGTYDVEIPIRKEKVRGR